MRRVSDYALAGDMRTGILVGRDGSIDWWCGPRFDAPAVFARLLGDDEAGFWRIAPAEPARVARTYRGDSLILETTFETAGGTVCLVDCMPLGTPWPAIVRRVEGRSGSVAMMLDLQPRMHYGSRRPWTLLEGTEWRAVVAPDALLLRATVPITDSRNGASTAFTVCAGESVTFVLQWSPAHVPRPLPVDADHLLSKTGETWSDWAGGLRYDGPYREPVVRSALTLKALTDHQSGALIAAVTTSLPERLGGSRNWDYRYCWLRDASFALLSLRSLGARTELRAWCDWFMRVYAGDPDQLGIMYGAYGERLGREEKLPWLGGFRGSAPVRIGNDAHVQVQLGVVGNVVAALVAAHEDGWTVDAGRWALLQPLIAHVERTWRGTGNGIWELRGKRRRYVSANALAALAAEGLAELARPYDPASARTATALAAQIRTDVLTLGYSRRRRAFTEYYGSDALDASVLLLPLHGFLSLRDRRMAATVTAIERRLCVGGHVYRYSPDIRRCGTQISAQEGAFALCGFWLVQVLVRMRRKREARRLFERLLQTANDVGVMAEEYDVEAREAVGNVPQALSHSGLIDAALALDPQPSVSGSRRRA